MPADVANVTSLTIRDKSLGESQRRYALPTVLLPTAGLAIAAVELVAGWAAWREILMAIVCYVITVVGITVGFHRYLTHRAFQTTGPVKAILAILGSMTAQGPVINWVSNHRRHHGHSDEPGDPHSPYMTSDGRPLGSFGGFWHAHLDWLFDGEITNALLFSKDLIRDPIIVRVNRTYLVWVLLGLVIPAAFGGWLFGSWFGVFQGFVWGGLVRVALNQHAVWSAGSLAHIFGERTFDTGAHEQSRNVSWLALPILGEGWHNNHHAFPHCAVFGFEWWQIDPSAWIIRALEKLGLAWDIKGVPPLAVRQRRLRMPSGASVRQKAI
jgi:stearoyl-CoA desaturase (delta-9 desaturase)